MTIKPPKRARTAYLVFCDRYREQIMRAVHPQPNAKFTREEMQAVTTKLAELWKNISPNELKECKAEADILKGQYEAEKAKFPPGSLKRHHKKGKKAKNQTILVEGQGEKPKRARTAYLIFCDKYRNQIMKEVHSNPNTKFTREEMQQVTTRLANMWRNVTPTELASCKMEADLCKEEYKRQKDSYRAPVYAPASKSKKGKKEKADNGKPKRPRTAYLLFAEDCRSKLKKTQPDLGFTEVSKVVSSEWKELPENKKQQYVRNAEKEQERHKVLKAQWEAKHPVA